MLGGGVIYPFEYQPDLLYPIDRSQQRSKLTSVIKFYGYDIWTAFEVSFLNADLRPVVAIVEIDIPADSEFMIESKSLKLYLNSLNNHKIGGVDFEDSAELLKKTLFKDMAPLLLSSSIEIRVFSFDDYLINRPVRAHLEGLSLDDSVIDDIAGAPDQRLIRLSDHGTEVREILQSDLLKSNCLITSQPDWGSVQISYHGRRIDHGSLLSYILSFRGHNEFHEHCVERIFTDIWNACSPRELTVYARYSRRGGIDINPIRSSLEDFSIDYSPLCRQ